MSAIPASLDPALANRIAAEVVNPKSDSIPIPDAPIGNVFQLCGDYMLADGRWTREFEVRELTGKDEERLGRISDSDSVMSTMLELGLVRVGTEAATKETVDGLVAADWETVLMAIRAVTFGPSVELEDVCTNCGSRYLYDVNLLQDIPMRTLSPEDRNFAVIGRHGTEYQMTIPMGSVKRKLQTMKSATPGEINSALIAGCLLSVNGRPILDMDRIVRDMPLADRRSLVEAIDSKIVGPDLQEVKTKCPDCGADKKSPVGIAALFL